MSLDDPLRRENAMKKIELLRKLTEDLVGIMDGSRPNASQLSNAVTLVGAQVCELAVPCLAGLAQGHPELGTKLITTSQIFSADPEGRWVRTLSRFYRIEPFGEQQTFQGTLQ
jgi:hypothetical protein